MNYISSIRFYGKHLVDVSERKLDFAIPSLHQKQTISIICGKNRTGKSYLLNRISRCIVNHNKKIDRKESYTQQKITEDDVDMFITNYKQSLERILFIDEIFKYIRFANSISVIRDSNFRKKAASSIRSDINFLILKNGLNDIVKETLLHIDSIYFDEEQWHNSDVYRTKTYTFLDINSLYKISGDNNLVKQFNQIVEGELYLGKKKDSKGQDNFELYLVYNKHTTLGFSNWSNGQKVLFVTMLMLHYHKPTIFIFDEIENHLHPQYISFFFDYVKKLVPQSIISTHHPHIIFSKYVDRVWYLEATNTPSNIENQVVKKKNRNSNKPPFRKAFELSKNIDKLAYTYKLFDGFDSQLLKLSSATLNNLNTKIVEIFKKLFHYDVVDSKLTKKPDIQSEKIYQYLQAILTQQKTINVLEIGAGSGRILKELIKINPKIVFESVNWFLLDPEAEVLKKEIELLGIENVKIITDILQIEQTIDLTLFVNVLHEIQPEEIAKYMYQLQNTLSVKGDILVVELFPLLFPEKFSIPMKSSEWVDLFRTLGMSTQVNSIHIKNGYIEAFWIRARWHEISNKSFNEIKTIIDDFIENTLLINRCADYKARFEFQDLDDEMVKIMCELTSIASISSYIKKQW